MGSEAAVLPGGCPKAGTGRAEIEQAAIRQGHVQCPSTISADPTGTNAHTERKGKVRRAPDARQAQGLDLTDCVWRCAGHNEVGPAFPLS
jgi:hypothetical protein